MIYNYEERKEDIKEAKKKLREIEEEQRRDEDRLIDCSIREQRVIKGFKPEKKYTQDSQPSLQMVETLGQLESVEEVEVEEVK